MTIETAKVDIFEDSIKFECISLDGEGGYPGTLTTTIIYSLTDENELKINYEAFSDADTICNLTNHTYFNLNGFDSGTMTNQKIQIFADNYTWANQESVPDGRIISVKGTPMDLRQPIRICKHIDDDFDELNFGHGYDHNWCINNYDGTLKKAAYVESNESGISLTVYTTLPGIQFYTGNFLDGDPVGKNGVRNNKRSGFSLEAQYYPNAINIPQFPQPFLHKSEKWTANTIYKLEVNDSRLKSRAFKRQESLELVYAASTP